MSKENDMHTTTIPHHELSFDSKEVLQISFTPDDFLRRFRNSTSLETLRDGLGKYLRLLRSAMIGLINKDYADFVNLSTYLIGLDKAIKGMQSPLGQLKEEIAQVKATLEESFFSVSELLAHHQDIFMRKCYLQNLLNIEFFLSNFNHILNSKEAAHKSFLNPVFTERVALEYNKSMHAMSQCEPYLSGEQRKKNSQICAAMMSGLNNTFLMYLEGKDIWAIAHRLRIYVALEKVSEAEMLYRKKIVAPAVSKIIAETAMQRHTRGFNAMYEQLLYFVGVEMKAILELGTHSRRFPAVKNFTFVLNSFWPEVEERLELDLPSIFYPGNPDLFHKNFTATEEFIKKLEYYCGIEGSVEKFRNHPQYHSFIAKWNLSVYYRIRFAEIGNPLEKILNDTKHPWTKPKDSAFQLLATKTAYTCAAKCFADDIFLKQLTTKFWKLTLLIFARYIYWVNTVLQKWQTSLEKAVGTVGNSTNEKHNQNAQQYLISLYLDLENLVEKLPNIQKLALHKAGGASKKIHVIFQENLDTTRAHLQDLKPKVTETIVKEVSRHSLIYLKKVSDIPRLYRRTNREVPTKACPYVLQLFEAPQKFQPSQEISVELRFDWLSKIMSNITKHFIAAVNDVLTSVHKTEESLRRLKKIRDKSVSLNHTDGKGIGDDDKIRIQIAVDVITYCKELEKMGLSTNGVNHVDQLKGMVNDIASKYNLV